MAFVSWYICFQDVVAKVFRIPAQFQRYWLWAKRQNHTYRPDRALTVQEEVQSVSSIWKSYISEVCSSSDLWLQSYWWCSLYISWFIFCLPHKICSLGLSHLMKVKRNDLRMIFLSVVWSYRPLPDNSSSMCDRQAIWDSLIH